MIKLMGGKCKANIYFDLCVNTLDLGSPTFSTPLLQLRLTLENK